MTGLMSLQVSTMKTAILILLCISETHNKDLVVGSILNSTLTYMEVAYNDAEPESSWEDEVYFTTKADRIIKAIQVQDLGETEKDIATITGGGVGHNFVNISLRSEPGFSLNYQIEIYS